MAFCRNCGKEMGEGNRFCSSCGWSLSTTSQSPAPTQNTSQGSSAIKSIGTALFVISIIMLLVTLGYAASQDSWDMEYGGGTETTITLGIITGISFIIGLCMMNTSPSNK